MKIECVVVSVDYWDVLAWTLPAAKQHFDRMVVVTTPQDKKTQKLCEFWHVQSVVTDACYRDGAPFNKGAMINEGLARLDKDGWCVHMDADIFLPPKTRLILEGLERHLDRETLYGMDRLMCRSFEEWMAYWYSPVVTNEADIYVHFPFEPGVRIAKMGDGYDGWQGIGFWQLFSPSHTRSTYPTQHTDAGRTDMLFSLSFPRSKRQLLPELVCIHLEMQMKDGGMGSNWRGRRTPFFGPAELAPEWPTPRGESLDYAD